MSPIDDRDASRKMGWGSDIENGSGDTLSYDRYIATKKGGKNKEN
jgi:hypothetical protein